jgi:hypothetical protein
VITALTWILSISIVIAISCAITLCVLAIRMIRKDGFTNKSTAFLALGMGALFIVYLGYYSSTIGPADQAQIILMIGLVAVTVIFATVATRQSRASITMAKEMHEQRYDSARPIIDIIVNKPTAGQRLVKQEIDIQSSQLQYLGCALQNIGAGPALDIYSYIPEPQRRLFSFGTLTNKENNSYPIKLCVEQMEDKSVLLAYYRDIYGRCFKSARTIHINEKEANYSVGNLDINLIEDEEFPK